MSRRHLTTCFIIFWGLLSAGCQGGLQPSPPTPPQQACAPVDPAGAVGAFQTLRAKAEIEGRVRVIVEVARPPSDPTALPELHSAAKGVFQAAGASYAEPLSARLPYLVAEVTPSQMDALYDDMRFGVWIEDRIARTTLAESGPLVQAPDLARVGGGGDGEAIAILDTGVDRSHPFLEGRVPLEACFSSSSAVNGSTSVCPNGGSEQFGLSAARPCNVQGCDHGTHVAGIAAGRGADFSGVAPDADIIAVQVFSRFTDPTVCGGAGACVASFTSDQIRGLDFVLQQAQTRSIAAANMSLGGGRSTSFCDGDFTKTIIDQLRAAGVATIVAAGNDGFRDAVSFPACISSAVTVAATTKADDLAAFSNCGAQVDLLAPGVSVASSLPGGRFGSLSGTSMAAPHVAGAFAALRSRTGGASIDQIEMALESSGRNVEGRPRIRLLDASETLNGAPRLARADSDGLADRALAPLAQLPPDAPGRFILRLRSSEAVLSVSRAAERVGADYVGRMGSQPMLVIEATPEQIRELAATGEVASVQVDRAAKPQK